MSNQYQVENPKKTKVMFLENFKALENDSFDPESSNWYLSNQIKFDVGI